MWRGRSRSLDSLDWFLMIRFGLNMSCLPPYRTRSHDTHVSPVTGRAGDLVQAGSARALHGKGRLPLPSQRHSAQFPPQTARRLRPFCLLTSPPKLSWLPRTSKYSLQRGEFLADQPFQTSHPPLIPRTGSQNLWGPGQEGKHRASSPRESFTTVAVEA